MKSDKNSSVLVSIFFLVIISLISVEARKHHTRKTKSHNKSGNGDTRGSNFTAHAPAPLPDHNGSYPTPSTIFDVLSFGAKGDGVSDDSKVRNSKQQQKNMFLLRTRQYWKLIYILINFHKAGTSSSMESCVQVCWGNSRNPIRIQVFDQARYSSGPLYASPRTSGLLSLSSFRLILLTLEQAVSSW